MAMLCFYFHCYVIFLYHWKYDIGSSKININWFKKVKHDIIIGNNWTLITNFKSKGIGDIYEFIT